jgi:hypothetical protein
MEVTITSYQAVKETVNIELPYYFHTSIDIEGGYVNTYGKIFKGDRVNPDVNVIVKHEDYHGNSEYRIESISLSTSHANPENKSTESKWSYEKQRAIDFITEF